MMRCKKCNYQNESGVKYCVGCGRELTPTRNIGILVTTCVLFCVLVINCFLLFGQQKERKYQTRLDSANRYLEALDYDKAKAEYLKAIKINPKEKDAYIQLGTLYEEEGDYEAAVDVYEDGIDKIPDKESDNLQVAAGNSYNQLEEYDKAEEKLNQVVEKDENNEEAKKALEEVKTNKEKKQEEEKEKSTEETSDKDKTKEEKVKAEKTEKKVEPVFNIACDVKATKETERIFSSGEEIGLGPFECSYLEDGGVQQIEKSGAIATYTYDFDHDDIDEILAINIEPYENEGEVEAAHFYQERNILTMTMYEKHKGALRPLHKYTMFEDVMGYGDSEVGKIFLQEKDGNLYICGDAKVDLFTFASGSHLQMFAVQYTTNGFEEYIKADYIGSGFVDFEEENLETIEKLEAWGLEKSAQNISENYLLSYDFSEIEGDALLYFNGVSTRVDEEGNIKDASTFTTDGTDKVIINMAVYEEANEILRKDSEDQEEEQPRDNREYLLSILREKGEYIPEYVELEPGSPSTEGEIYRGFDDMETHIVTSFLYRVEPDGRIYDMVFERYGVRSDYAEGQE